MQGGFEEGESDLDDIFIGVKELSGKSLKEKWEGKVSADEFYKNSIFYLFDMLKNITEADPSKNSLGPFYDYIPNLDFLLCTDMGPEQADFIISSKSKLVFVHIKCGKTKKPESSAGALFEVGSQALKNMEHMISLNKQLKASNSGYMVKSWPSGNAKNRLNERVRLLNGKRFINVENNPELRKKAYEDAWDVVIERRSSPRVEKEIWVVAGNSFSKSDFFTQLNLGNKGRATSLQAYQLIQSWNATASSEDIGIKFFVSK